MRKNSIWGYLFLLPFLSFFGLFVIFPLIRGVYMSMTKWGLYGGNLGFIGLKNYQLLFDPNFFMSRQFWESMWATTQFMIFSVPLFIFSGLGLAILINNQFLKIKTVSRMIFFVPVALSAPVIAVIWMWLLEYNSGLINFLLTFIGIGRIPWLTQQPWAWISIVITTLWWTVGWNMIIFLGGLQNIPTELYDAAKVDGSNSWNTFIHITLPGLRNVIFFITIFQIIASFNLFAQPQLMTGGGPGRSTLPVMLYIYQTAFNFSLPYMGISSAMSVISGGIILIIIMILFLTLGKEAY